MTIRNLARMALAAGALIGLAGCEGLPGKARHDDAEQIITGIGCNPGQNRCRVEVTVTNCRSSNGFVANPDRLEVDERSLIVWDIVTDGYKFTPGGINIKRNDGVFERPRPVGDGKRYAWHDKHRTHRYYVPGTYEYAISVVREDGTVQCRTFDPRISNR